MARNESPSIQRKPLSFGAPVVAVGATAAILLAALLVGGTSLLIAPKPGAEQSKIAVAVDRPQPQEAEVSEDQVSEDTLGTSDSTQSEESEDSTPTPDRGSDQKPQEAESGTVYVIQPGDTLTSISGQFGIGIDTLAAFNSVRDANIISEWATIVIPPVGWLPVDEGGATALQ